MLVEGPFDALAVDVASRGMLAGVAPLGTALTDAQAAQLASALPSGSDRVVVASDPDPAGRQAAGRAYELLAAHKLDPRGAALPAGLDPAATLDMYGPAMLMSRVTGAEPMGRQLVDQALAGRDLTWVEDRVAVARIAAAIITNAPPTTWQREIAAVSDRIELAPFTLREAVVDHIGTDFDALGRLTGRDRRDDLDRGQHIHATAAQLAAMSTPRRAAIRAAAAPPTDITSPAHIQAPAKSRGRH